MIPVFVGSLEQPTSATDTILVSIHPQDCRPRGPLLPDPNTDLQSCDGGARVSQRPMRQPIRQQQVRRRLKTAPSSRGTSAGIVFVHQGDLNLGVCRAAGICEAQVAFSAHCLAIEVAEMQSVDEG